jgi:hypothetical protein
MPPGPFAFIIFSILSLFYTWAGLECNLSIYASHLAGMTGLHHHAQLFICRDGGGGLTYFFPGLAWNFNTPDLGLLDS